MHKFTASSSSPFTFHPSSLLPPPSSLILLLLTLGFIGCAPDKTSSPSKTTKPTKAPAATVKPAAKAQPKPATTAAPKPVPAKPLAKPAPATKPVAKAPTATKPLSATAEAKLIARINRTDDIFALHKTKEKLQDAPAATPRIMDALTKKYEQVMAKLEPTPIPETVVDVLAFDFRNVTGDTYQVSILLRANGPIPSEEDLGMYMQAFPENEGDLAAYPDAFPLLRNGKRVPNHEWILHPEPPTTKWGEGECILLRKQVPAKPIVYSMHIGFLPDRKQTRYGKRAKIPGLWAAPNR